jgi:hypothetical protein
LPQVVGASVALNRVAELLAAHDSGAPPGYPNGFSPFGMLHRHIKRVAHEQVGGQGRPSGTPIRWMGWLARRTRSDGVLCSYERRSSGERTKEWELIMMMVAMQVRNAGSWAGNLMLFKRHRNFPSDINVVSSA